VNSQRKKMRHDLFSQAMTHPGIHGGRGHTDSQRRMPFNLGKSFVKEYRVNVVAGGHPVAIRQ